MVDENYGEDPQNLPPAAEETAAAPDSEEKGEAMTFLVNKEVCPGMKVGDELKARVVSVGEKEYQMEYTPEESEETPPEPETEPGMEAGPAPTTGSDGNYA